MKAIVTVIGKDNLYLINVNIDVSRTAVGVNDHIDLTLVHSDRYASDNVGSEAHFAKRFFDPYGSLAGRSKVIAVYLEMEINEISHYTTSPP